MVTLTEIKLKLSDNLYKEIMERGKKTALKNLIAMAKEMGDGSMVSAIENQGLPKSILCGENCTSIVLKILASNPMGIKVSSSKNLEHDMIVLDWAERKSSNVDTIQA